MSQSTGTKFEPIKDAALKKLSVEDRIKALGGVHLAYVEKFHDVLAVKIVEGLTKAKNEGRALNEVCFVLGDREDEFWNQNYIEVNTQTGEVTAGHAQQAPVTSSDRYRWRAPGYFLDTRMTAALIEQIAPHAKLLSEGVEVTPLRDIDKLCAQARRDDAIAWGERRYAMWFMYRDVLAMHPIAREPTHPHFGTWTDMNLVSEYGPKVLVITMNAASAQIVQPIPDEPTPG